MVGKPLLPYQGIFCFSPRYKRFFTPGLAGGCLWFRQEQNTRQSISMIAAYCIDNERLPNASQLHEIVAVICGQGHQK